MLTDLAVKIIERLLATLTEQTARDVLAAYLLPVMLARHPSDDNGAAERAYDAAECFLDERAARIDYDNQEELLAQARRTKETP